MKRNEVHMHFLSCHASYMPHGSYCLSIGHSNKHWLILQVTKLFSMQCSSSIGQLPYENKILIQKRVSCAMCFRNHVCMDTAQMDLHKPGNDAFNFAFTPPDQISQLRPEALQVRESFSYSLIQVLKYLYSKSVSEILFRYLKG
jgi:hypothetical protein